MQNTLKNESRARNTARNTLFGAAMFVTKMLLQFAVRAVFNRYFITEYLGLNGLYSNILNVLSLAELGVGNAIVYSMYKPIADNDTEQIKSLVTLYRKLYIIIGIVITVIGLAIIPALPFLIKDTPNVDINLNIVYILYLAQTVIGYFFAYRRSLIFAYQRNDLESKISFIVQILLAVTQIIIMVVWKNYYAYVSAIVVFNLLDALIVFFVSYKIFPDIRGKAKKLEKSYTKEIAKNTGAMVFHKLGSAIVFSTDSIIISAFVGLNILGIYSNYTLLTTALTSALNLILTAVKGSIGNLIATSDRERVYKIFNALNLLFMWALGFIFVGVMVCAQDFMTLLTGDSTKKLSYLSLMLIMLSFYLTMSRQMTNNFKECAGLFWNDRLKPIFEAGMNLGLDILLVHFLGLNGVILATIISTILIPLWVEPFVLYKHYFKKSVNWYFVRYMIYVFVAAIAYCITFGICYFIPNDGIGWFILKFLISLIIPNVVYFIAFFKTSAFKFLFNTFKSMFAKSN